MPERKNIRLKHHDYTSHTAYFITICTHNRQHLFGEIQNGEMYFNLIGKMIDEMLFRLPENFGQSQMLAKVIMPNHLHFIWLHQDTATLSDVVKTLKGRATTVYRAYLYNHDLPFKKLWQRGYHEHGIRSEQDFLKIAQYIENNPKQWELDCFYPHENGGKGRI